LRDEKRSASPADDMDRGSASTDRESGVGPTGAPAAVSRASAFPPEAETKPDVTKDSVEKPRESMVPGALLADKYMIENIVGEGGIGIVVSAKHIQLDQTVAIKYLRPKAAGMPAVAERFLREARLAAKIRSEHVVRVYDVGLLPDGAPYMVMEYLAGTDLGKMLTASGTLPLDRAIDYILQACEALAEAHVAGIVHRDLKPDNLFVATGAAGKSVVKILDFGISKLSEKRTTSSGRLSQLTQADDRFGTPVYMSPEQLLSSSDVDARADLWAIGVVLYELLTGVVPFDGDSLPELVTAILNLPPRKLTAQRPYLPSGLQDVIERCLEKKRDDRYQNVAELVQELRPFAPPHTHSRIDHVVRIIREAGENVRPPTPMPGASAMRAVELAETLAAGEARNLLTTGSGAGSWGHTNAGAARRRWTTARVVGAAAIVVAVVGLVAMLRSAGDTEVASLASIGVAQAVTIPSLPEASSPTPVAPLPVAATVAPLASTAPEPTRPSLAPLAPLRGRPGAKDAKDANTSPTTSAAPKKAPSAPTFDPTGVIDPFQ
jgi:serine/threonine protein kinase